MTYTWIRIGEPRLKGKVRGAPWTPDDWIEVVAFTSPSGVNHYRRDIFGFPPPQTEDIYSWDSDASLDPPYLSGITIETDDPPPGSSSFVRFGAKYDAEDDKWWVDGTILVRINSNYGHVESDEGDMWVVDIEAGTQFEATCLMRTNQDLLDNLGSVWVGLGGIEVNTFVYNDGSDYFSNYTTVMPTADTWTPFKLEGTFTDGTYGVFAFSMVAATETGEGTGNEYFDMGNFSIKVKFP